ncbi:GNAT family N-acetyltransferase [Clostridium intestinale]|jgi:RimJ/RimL family protein N-acetyltransferase|uniref:N-acetyltransferase GCN5 n=1 Tax=Clostridium intestinale URNW TaxID=1294142 RepID=U2NJQ5_9CLOT|nr:GNAT family N-acetyltransferase [Clostridium intestinale]ERK29388.1 N-acetyltransferase GCN5 [Clostridium intestinale URNW]
MEIELNFRKTVESDVNNVMGVIKQAQDYFKERGINQWQNNYPNSDTINNDITKGHSYVLLKDEDIVATVAVSFDGESTYNNIYDGKWLTNDKYAVIHRIAVDNTYKGLGLSSEIIKRIEELCVINNVHSIKVDTHRENLSMQRLLKKNNFEYCGIIYLLDGNERIAFEKIF